MCEYDDEFDEADDDDSRDVRSLYREICLEWETEGRRITSLDLKNEARRREPNLHIVQADVSDFLRNRFWTFGMPPEYICRPVNSTYLEYVVHAPVNPQPATQTQTGKGLWNRIFGKKN